MADEQGRDPKSDLERDRCACDYDKLVELIERITRLEEDNKWLKSQLKEIARRDWYILAGISISILIGIFDLLLRLAVAH